jgi:hypothetical protein
MAEIIQVYTVARRVFQPDSVPWPLITLPTNLQKLKERYKFGELVQGPEVGEICPIIATAGEFSNSGLLSPVQQVIMEPNMIQTQTASDDKGEAILFSDLVSWFGELKGGALTLAERAKTFQTIAIVKIDVDFTEMVSEKMLSYLSEAVAPAIKTSDADAEIELQSLSWRISYRSHSTDIAYLPKAFAIEPRNGTSASEKVYYTISPTDYTTHMKVLSEFEKRFGKKSTD